MKARFIYNPRSGRNRRHPGTLRRIREFVTKTGWDATVVATERPRHATELAARARDEGCELVVAVGGDGTLNEIAQALVASPVTLGLVPGGSGNGLGLHLGISTLSQALETLATGRTLLIDTGTANGLPFFNAMGAGFDAEISWRFNRLVRRGLPAYLRTGLGALIGFRPQAFTVRSGAAVMDSEAFLVAVANSDQYGNHAAIAPGARVDDGKLDLVLVKPVTPFNALPLFVRLFTRSFDGSPSVRRVQGNRFVIQRGQAGRIHTDGETHDTGAEIDVRIRPASLRVKVPRHGRS